MKIEINSIGWLAWLWLIFSMNVGIFIIFAICVFLAHVYFYIVEGIWNLPLNLYILEYILRRSIPAGIIGGTAMWIVAKKEEIDNKRKAKEEQENALSTSEEPSHENEESSHENNEDSDNSKTN